MNLKLNNNLQPRDWQLQALDIWKKDLKGVVSVVTGGGKTIFAELCMAFFSSTHPSGIIVIIVPTLALLDQWIISLQEDLGLSTEDISLFSGQEKSTKLSLINIFVINSARRAINLFPKDLETFLIVDECHRSGSAENSLSLKIPHIASLGLSATPERQYDNGFNEYIVPSLGNIIFTYGYEDAYKDNVICPFELINIKVDFLEGEQTKFDSLSKKIAIELDKISREKSTDDRLKILLQQRSNISSTAFMRIPVAVKIAEREKNHRIIIFHERVDDANFIFKLLAERNFGVTIYHSKINPIIRRDNLKLYRRKLFDTLVSCKALDEGLNIPDTSIAIIASSNASVRQRIQRMGRVLRPSLGKKSAKIITLYVTDNEERRLINEANSLTEISSVSWFTARGHGEYFGKNII